MHHIIILATVYTKESVLFGGARRDRTADLLRATQALCQLSYSPLGLYIIDDGVP